jgi:hypothetical protein
MDTCRLSRILNDLTWVRDFIACATIFDEVEGKLQGVLDGLPKDATMAALAAVGDAVTGFCEKFSEK